MGVDLRQVVAGILTITMFVMLGNMIKRDHFDSVEVSYFFNHHSFLFHTPFLLLTLSHSVSASLVWTTPIVFFFFHYMLSIYLDLFLIALQSLLLYLIIIIIFYGICLQLRSRSWRKCKSNKTHFLLCCFLWNQFVFYVEIDRIICLTSVCLMRK